MQPPQHTLLQWFMDWQPQTSLNPTDDAIEAIIQQATSAAPSKPSGSLRDTRTQLFVGNVLLFFFFRFLASLMSLSSFHIESGGRTSKISSGKPALSCVQTSL